MVIISRIVLEFKIQVGPKRSIALPYTTTELNTGLVGDFGFDPFGLATAESKCTF